MGFPYRVTPPPPKGFTQPVPYRLFSTLPGWTKPVTREIVFWSGDFTPGVPIVAVGVSSGYPVIGQED